MSAPSSFIALLFVALAMTYCLSCLANDDNSERRSILGIKHEHMKTETKAVLYNKVTRVNTINTSCDVVGDEHKMTLILQGGQNRTWGFKDKIDPSKRYTCTLQYDYTFYFPAFDVDVTSYYKAQFDVLPTHKCISRICVWYVQDDGIFLRNPRTMEDILRIGWEWKNNLGTIW